MKLRLIQTMAKFTSMTVRGITLILTIITAVSLSVVHSPIKAAPTDYIIIGVVDSSGVVQQIFATTSFEIYRSTNPDSMILYTPSEGSITKIYKTLEYSSSANAYLFSGTVTASASQTVKYRYDFSSSSWVSASGSYSTPLRITNGMSLYISTLSQSYTLTAGSITAYIHPLGYNDIFPYESGVTEQQVKDIIDEQLNTTTSTSQDAITIINNTTTSYNQYINNEISYQELQAIIQNNLTTLNQLTESDTNTLADLVNINNAITYNQSVADSLNKDQIIDAIETNTDEIIDNMQVTPSVATAITGYVNQANIAFDNYDNRTVNQTDTLKSLNQYITYLSDMITDSTPQADIIAINTAINTINGIKDSVRSHSDLDKDVAKSFRDDEQADIDLLESVLAETTEPLDSLMPSMQHGGLGGKFDSAQTIIEGIYNDPLLAIIIPISGGAMLICIILGVKYRL